MTFRIDPMSFVGFQVYKWKDQVIEDIEAWAKERGEKMVEYERTTERPNMFTGRMSKEVSKGVMPESFWCSLGYVAVGPAGSVSYIETSRRDPKGPRLLDEK